jgi:hypothetical protein
VVVLGVAMGFRPASGAPGVLAGQVGWVLLASAALVAVFTPTRICQ